MIYEILDGNGDVTDTIMADEDFMTANYAVGSYRLAADQTIDGPTDAATSDPAAVATILESARTQNVLTTIAENIWPTRLTSMRLMDRWAITTDHDGLVAGDIVISLTEHNTFSPEPSAPDDLWTSNGATVWWKIFDFQTKTNVKTLLATPIDKNLAALEETGVVNQTSSTRTVTRRAIDSELNETTQTSTESRTVQASHIPPYPTISDTGWV